MAAICSHPRTTEGRVIMADGRYHVMRRCDLCGANALGPGRWLPRRKGQDLEALPVFSDARPAPGSPVQRTLFGGGGP
jgi:hypothetical protein